MVKLHFPIEWLELVEWSQLPSGKRLHNYGKSPFLMGKLTISMAIFNSKVLVYPVSTIIINHY